MISAVSLPREHEYVQKLHERPAARTQVDAKRRAH
jgi:hypothetical protein